MKKIGGITLRKLMKMELKYLAGAMAVSALAVLANLLTPMILAEAVDRYFLKTASRFPASVTGWIDAVSRGNTARALTLMAAALVTVSVLGGVFSFFRGRWQAMVGANCARTLRDDLYSHIQSLPFSYHARAETGDMIQRCTSDVETVRRFLSAQLISVVNALLTVVLSLSVLFRANAALTWYSLILVPLLFGFGFFFFRWVIRRFKQADEAEGKMSAVLQEALTGVRVVRAFGRQRHEEKKFDAVSADYRTKAYNTGKLIAFYWASSDFIISAQCLITMILCVLYAVRGEITVGTLIIFTTYVGRMLWPIRQMGRILADAGKSSVALGRIRELLEAKPEPEEKDALKPALDGDIVFDHVTFAYEDGREVLSDVSCVIPHGKTTAILGATGSGKSTLVELLQRLYEPGSGEIRVSGVPLSKIDRKYLRSRVGLVLQEPFLYSRTIRENVAAAVEKAENDEIESAARDACAEEFILESAEGWDTVVGERGVTLSGGQKQRLAIARTLMKQNDVLIFDDSLSAVDTHTDALIRERLKKRRANTTTLIISHRISTLREADRILVLEDGKITQQGTHEELMRQEGLYRRIADIQSGAASEGE